MAKLSNVHQRVLCTCCMVPELHIVATSRFAFSGAVPEWQGTDLQEEKAKKFKTPQRP